MQFAKLLAGSAVALSLSFASSASAAVVDKSATIAGASVKYKSFCRTGLTQ